jgi:hypothetical protein
MTIREVKMAFKNDWTSHFKCPQVTCVIPMKHPVLHNQSSCDTRETHHCQCEEEFWVIYYEMFWRHVVCVCAHTSSGLSSSSWRASSIACAVSWWYCSWNHLHCDDDHEEGGKVESIRL